MSRFRCLNCRATFAEPSFSEGPKKVDPDTLQVVRFSEARSICPSCFSPRITPVHNDAQPRL